MEKSNIFLPLIDIQNYDKTYHDFNWDILLNCLIKEEEFNSGDFIIDYEYDRKKDKPAILWENNNGDSKVTTFRELKDKSNKFANILSEFGIKKGDRVFTFLDRTSDIYYIFLGILKCGAIAGNFFPAFGKEALFDRLKNSQAKVLVTTKDLAKRVKEIEKDLPDLKKIICIDCDFNSLLENASPEYNAVNMGLDDPMFMLYTSATGNTPISGIVIPQKAILQHFYSAKWILDLKNDDIYWCTADPGWVTGTVYGIIAPIMLGVTQIVYDGRFDLKKWYSMIKKYKVTVLYTAPTAIRMLEHQEKVIDKEDVLSLRHICAVGEALYPSTIEWVMRNINKSLYDTYWQTETGGIMIANFPGLKVKPGSMGKPIPGVLAEIIDEQGTIMQDGLEGNLAFKKGWPGMLIDVWQNKNAYKRYFLNDWFLTGDRAYKDKDGYFWFVGRANDVIKTAGERVGPFEVESAISKHPLVLENAVIGKPDEIRGQIIKAFIVLKQNVAQTENLKIELQDFVKKELAGHAYPREIEFVEKLPKNKSGKIVRRILKAKDAGLPIGDISTLEDDYLK